MEGHVEHFEWCYTHKDGRIIPMLITATLFGEEKKEIIQMWQDITTIKKLQDERTLQEAMLIQQGKLAEMGEMIGAIAHQWKQPINTISILTQNIQDSIEDKAIDVQSISEASDHILDQLEFMNQTINDFRNFLSPSKSNVIFNPHNSIKEILNILQYKLRIVSIAVDFHVEKDFSVYGCPNELKQAIFNIFKNSIDAFEEKKRGNKKIEVYLNIIDDMGEIKICDNGGGIPQDLLPDKLFEPYISTKGQKGTGIGLQLVKRIITEHFDGEIKAYNGEDGACFEIILPIKKKHEGQC